MTNGKQISILAALIIAITGAATLSGCDASLINPDSGMSNPDGGVINPDNGVINCPAILCPDGAIPTPGSDGSCQCPGTGTVTVTGTLRSGREFITTGMVGGESCAPVVVGIGIEPIAGTSCTVTGQIVACTGIPVDGEFFTIHGCVSVNGSPAGFIHPVDNTPGCPTPGQDYVSLTVPGGAVVGVNTSTTGGVYCRNTVVLDY